jgi:cysteinyl-tRNA synthetase
MALVLHDTLAAKEVPFVPSEPGKARIYVCGPTTYDDAHIGHARPCVTYDVLVRFLRSTGVEVTYVRNVTDIDDKIIQRAAQNGESPKELSDRMFLSYTEDMDRLGNLRPDREPKVSETLPEIIELVEKLIARGHAYQVGSDVYFEVSSLTEISQRWRRGRASALTTRSKARSVTRSTLHFGKGLKRASLPGRVLGDRGAQDGTSSAAR